MPKEKKQEEKKEPGIFLHIELSEKGELTTAMNGDTLVLLGLSEVLRDNIKARMGVRPAANE